MSEVVVRCWRAEVGWKCDEVVEESLWWGICELSSFRVKALRNHGSPAALVC